MQRKIRRLLKIANIYIYITEEVYQDVNETQELNTSLAKCERKLLYY